MKNGAEKMGILPRWSPAAGGIDIGNVGKLPPVFAQAGGNPIVYVAALTQIQVGVSVERVNIRTEERIVRCRKPRIQVKLAVNNC